MLHCKAPFWSCNFSFASAQPALSLIIVLFFLSTYHAQSQQEFSSPVEGMLGKSGAVDETPWSFFTNPSGLATVQMPSVGAGYASNYNLKELSSRALFVALPTKWMVVGGGFVHQGFEHFNYQQYSVITSRQMAPWLRLALKPNITIRHQTGLNDITVFTLDAGLMLQPHSQVLIGFYTNNPAYVKWRFEDGEHEQFPSTVGTAISYNLAGNFEIELGVLKRNYEEAHISFGLTTPLHKSVTLRAAASSAPIRLALGLGIKWQDFTFDMGLNHHESLGFSSAFGIIYSLPRTLKSQE